MKSLYILYICIFPFICQAQALGIKSQLENSNDYYDRALEEIKFALSTLERCENTHSIDMINNHASDSKEYLIRAQRHVSSAKDLANDIKKATTDLDCPIAHDLIDNAGALFYDAKKLLSSAIVDLSGASGKDELNKINFHLSNAKNHINQAVVKLNIAALKLKETRRALDDCD